LLWTSFCHFGWHILTNVAAPGPLRSTSYTLLDDFAYYLVYPKDSHVRPNVAAFREWILAASKTDSNQGLA
jgi:DNA-binding transcriptional LysR family regulator